MSGKFILEMTQSQQMALIDIVMEVLHCDNKRAHSEVFINCSSTPAIETTPGQLLRLLNEATWKDDANGRETG